MKEQMDKRHITTQTIRPSQKKTFGRCGNKQKSEKKSSHPDVYNLPPKIDLPEKTVVGKTNLWALKRGAWETECCFKLNPGKGE